MRQRATFDLKCVCCGAKDKRPASECMGADSPICKTCFGPMVLDRVTVSDGPARPLPPDGLAM